MALQELGRGGQEITPTTDVGVLKGELGDILKREGELYRPNFDTTVRFNKFGGRSLREFATVPQLAERVLAIHKILFLTGGGERDVTRAIDPWGNLIYTKKPDDDDTHKPPEIAELIAVDTHFREDIVDPTAKKLHVRRSEVDLRNLLGWDELPKVISEIADVVYNLHNIDFLDTLHSDYEGYIVEIASCAEYSLSEMLYLVYLKYDLRIRQNGKKDVPGENKRIGDALRRGRLPIPNLSQLSDVWRRVSLIDTETLPDRKRSLTEGINQDIEQNLTSRMNP